VTDTPRRYVAALAAKDTDALLALFADDVAFRGMTPGRFWEAATPAEVVHDVLYRWFEPEDVIEQVEAVEPGEVAGRQRVDYRFLVRNAQGLHAVEQRAYLDLDGTGRVTRMQAMCAGFRPVG
jgi:ketosteroid isomerase-like protein